jgi:5-methylcytosine-specific restriction protein A
MSPFAAARPCRNPTCPALIRSGRFCPEHAREYEARRGSPSSRGYDARHRAWRLAVLADHPVCQDPDRRHPDHQEPATTADHIVALVEWERDAEAAALRLLLRLGNGTDAAWLLTELHAWSLLNGQGLCASCHSSKTARENRR